MTGFAPCSCKAGFQASQFGKADPYLGGTNRRNDGGNPLFPEEGVSRIPQELSDLEASTLPCAALTAWSALIEEGRLKSGDSVLIQGTGGVSLFALQFAKMVGAQAMVISGSEEKMQRAKDLGADEVLNYRENPEWGKQVREFSGGEGIDHIVEVGGRNTSQSLRRSARVERFP